MGTFKEKMPAKKDGDALKALPAIVYRVSQVIKPGYFLEM